MYKTYIFFDKDGYPNFRNQILREQVIYETQIKTVVAKDLATGEEREVEIVENMQIGSEWIPLYKQIKQEDGSIINQEIEPVPEGAIFITPEQHEECITALNEGKKLEIVNGEIKIVE